ncbi:DUF6966 domain-containing protein [Mycobacterium timonense]|uniref:DUF6966 domain-containing protein n=1 Tax=Mycobacterium timonense TaxID=701043 RepID=UPI00115233A8|nr:hypothetical protein [Mycobacterium timonense]
MKDDAQMCTAESGNGNANTDNDLEVPADLLGVLDELIDKLPTFDTGTGCQRWVTWLARSRQRIARGDPHGIDELLSAYGGMGSFNDLELTDDLDRLRSRARQIARRPKRELDARDLE